MELKEGRKEERGLAFVGEGGRGYVIINVKDGIGWDFCHLIGGVSVIVNGAVLIFECESIYGKLQMTPIYWECFNLAPLHFFWFIFISPVQ